MKTKISDIRVSLGTAISLGLKNGYMPAPPTTAYLMLGEECLNNCAFCTQAKGADSSGNLLSRVTWPLFSFDRVLATLKEFGKVKFERICIQCLNDPSAMSDLDRIVRELRKAAPLPISISVGPIGRNRLELLKEAGVERVGIAIDGGSPEVFEIVKGSYVGNPHSYEGTWEAMAVAVEVFGKGKVSTHIIVGMGETDRNIADTLIRACETGVSPSLFSYTPMRGTVFKGTPPPLGRYRALQLLRHCIVFQGNADPFMFDDEGRMTDIKIDLIRSIPNIIDSFRTRGCPDCNRPYYNERPTGPIYNYPLEVDEGSLSDGISEAEAYIKSL